MQVKESETEALISVDNGSGRLSDGVGPKAPPVWKSNKDLQAWTLGNVAIFIGEDISNVNCSSDEDVAGKDGLFYVLGGLQWVFLRW